jgi:hypothetical protein
MAIQLSTTATFTQDTWQHYTAWYGEWGEGDAILGLVQGDFKPMAWSYTVGWHLYLTGGKSSGFPTLLSKQSSKPMTNSRNKYFFECWVQLEYINIVYTKLFFVRNLNNPVIYIFSMYWTTSKTNTYLTVVLFFCFVHKCWVGSRLS